MTISDKSIALILDSEGIDQPWKWPGGGSGITLGYGSDIGADHSALSHWEGVLSADEIALLKQAVGVTGRDAAQIASRFRGIKISRDQAWHVFRARTLPRWITKTVQTFPGIDRLPADARGALVSIVFNRGPSTEGPRRAEMKEIQRLILAHSREEIALPDVLQKIAEQIQSMKRLWVGQGLDGLLTRRDNEALLVLNAA